MATRSPQLSILIPCYNEVHRLGSTLEAVLHYLGSRSEGTELILVDDGSTDGTDELIEKWAVSHPSIRTATLQPNQGKGAALQAGVQAACGHYVIFFDADLSYPLSDIERFLDALATGADLAIGGRDLDPVGSRSYSHKRRLGSIVFNRLVGTLLGLEIPDTQCGFKAFKTPIAQALFSHLTIKRFGFDVELLYLAKRWGLIIERVAVQMKHQPGSSVRLVRDSVQMFREILRIRKNASRGVYPETCPTAG